MKNIADLIEVINAALNLVAILADLTRRARHRTQPSAPRDESQTAEEQQRALEK